MAAMSDYLENALTDHALGTADFTSPSTVYLALYTSDPTDANTGTEVSGGSYARQSIAFAAASGGTASNNADVQFPTATADWGTVTHWGLFDASTNGNLLFHGSFDVSKPVTEGDVFYVQSGELDVTGQ